MKVKSKAAGPTRRSGVRPIAILAGGLIAAVAIALLLSRGGTDPAGSADLASLSGSDATAAHVRGPESATVTVTEFGDYQCPTCAIFHPIVAQLMDRFPTQLKFEFHHFPLITIHANAIYAAMAAEAAAEQGAFWEMHDVLFALQQDWSTHPNPEQLFLTYARDLGLNGDAFSEDLKSDAIQERVMTDLARAQELRLQGTPSFFVNDQPIPLPRSYSEFENYITAAINNAE